MDWVFPDVQGWLLPVEGRKLADLARDKRVLEIGSYRGLSTICMAQTARSVTCIDPFTGEGTSEPGETFADFKSNLKRYGVAGKVTAYRATTAEVARSIDGPFDLVFIDGAHDFASISTDVAAAEHLLTPGGLMVFHDYRKTLGEHDGRWDPDVTEAVDTYCQVGAKLLETAGTLAIVQPPAKLASGAVRMLRKRDRTKPLVLLAMPSYDGKCSVGAASGFYQTPTRGLCDVERAEGQSSFLTKTFNDLWCAALNRRALGFTHFAMIHADIIPQPGWLDVLLAELIRLDADVVSAVSPLKTPHGWTSTAIAIDDDDPWLRRRLAMKEVYDLPETFCAADVGGPLLLNTALWVCRLDRPWCEQVCFDVFNRIVRDKDGLWHAEAISEDWLFSAALNRLGAKLYATRKVTLNHDGGKLYPTDHVWGTQERDEVFFKLIQERIERHAAHQIHEGISGEGCRLPGGTAGAEALAGSGKR